jgi:hypothetical protein
MSNTGLVVSTMVNLATVEMLFPQSSLTVKVTVTSPVLPQEEMNFSPLPLSFVHV